MPKTVEIKGISVSDVPECIREPQGDRRLRSWLGHLDALSDGAEPDGVFTKTNFHHARKKLKEGRGLRRFKRFGQFKKFVGQYIDSQRCTPECLEKPLHSDLSLACFAPEVPELPSLPKPPRKKPDISDLTTQRPDWFDHPTPPESSRPDIAPSHIPTIAQLNGVEDAPALQGFEAEAPDITDLSIPVVDVMFDGVYFIMDFHGCIVDSRESMRCVADWPYFLLHLHNTSTWRDAKQEADVRGLARVKVPAQKGDLIAAWGTDRFWGKPSQSKDYYRIDEEGEVRLERSEALNLKDKRVLAHVDSIGGAELLNVGGIAVTLPPIFSAMKSLLLLLSSSDYREAYQLWSDLPKEPSFRQQDKAVYGY